MSKTKGEERKATPREASLKRLDDYLADIDAVIGPPPEPESDTEVA